MEILAEQLRSAGSNLDLHEALQAPVSMLLGVNDAAIAALHGIGIDSVFDLGTSTLFAQVDTIIRPGWAPVGRVPSDVLDSSGVPDSVEKVSALPIAALRGLSDPDAAALKAALGVETIQDLANWPPRRAALGFVQKALGADVAVGGDIFADRLRPAMGEYPTERVYYDKLLMFGTAADPGLAELDGAISLTSDATANLNKPAVGALMTLSQSWYAQGITLGHMIHSLALAPGEATRLAVIDWSRRTSASTSESIAESERLDDSTTHSRAISEVQNAVASEMQSGGSMSSGWAKSKSKGWNISGSVGGGIAGAIGAATGALGISVGGGYSSQSSETSYGADSSSWSVGNRSTSASLTQNVNDRTEQHASSVRSRRATAVREVSQSEHEQISTRVVANYNHMHALTVQYYEVVQVYRVVVRPHSVDRVLFLPFELIDFSVDEALDVVARYRWQLLNAALTPRVAELIVDPVGMIDVRSAVRVETPLNIFADAALGLTRRAIAVGPGGSDASPEPADPVPDPGTPPAHPIRTVLRTRRGPVEDSVPGASELVRISFEGLSIAHIRLDLSDTTTGQEFPVPAANDLTIERVKLANVASLLVASADGAADSGTITLHCEVEGRPVSVSIPVDLAAGTAMQRIAFIDADPSDRKGELLAHLQANRDYYTRAILAGLDAATLVPTLARFSWNGKPLVDQVEPVPVTVAGNYLVLRAPARNDDASGVGDEDWQTVLRTREIILDIEDSRLVPIPTGGVFAEAVLGRSNSAEKLDITRFWNWQDSPIPLQPPEIAPIAAGTRATPENLVPGQLGAPILNIMNPTNLPDPTGLSAILSAVANGNMFRDMSGLAGTQAAGQAMSSGTLAAATEAGRINSDNYKAATQAATEMAKTAADMWKAYQGSNGNQGGSNHSTSAEGARINHGRDMDERGVSPSASSGSTDSVPGSDSAGSPGSSPGGGSGSSAGGTDRMEPMSNEWSMSRSGAGIPSLADMVGAAMPGVSAIPAAVDVSKITDDDQKDLDQIKEDYYAVNMGSPLSATLIPMALHRNGQDLSIYLAWTNSTDQIFWNLDLSRAFYDVDNNNAFIKSIVGPTFNEYNIVDDDGNIIMSTESSDAISNTDRENLSRALNVLGLVHEVIHLQQFRKNKGPPKSFKQMVEFEIEAYGKSADWLRSPYTRHLFMEHFKLPPLLAGDATHPALTDYFATADDETKSKLQALNLGGSPASIRDALKQLTLLPAEIQGRADYQVTDMYKT